MSATQQIFAPNQDSHVPWGLRAIFYDVMDLIQDGNYETSNGFTIVTLEPHQHEVINENWNKFEQFLKSCYRSKWQIVALSETTSNYKEHTFYVVLKQHKWRLIKRLFSRLFGNQLNIHGTKTY